MDRVTLFGTQIDRVNMAEAVATIGDWCREDRGDACRFVVTPNVNHIVMLRSNDALQRAYEHAALIVLDGTPLVWCARLLGKPVPERVAGSDLVPALFRSIAPNEELTAYLLGAAEGVAERAKLLAEQRYPRLRIVGTYSPPFGFERDEQENRKILERIAMASPQVLVLGLGAPKQELWIDRHRHAIQAKVALCVGATIDFLAEAQPRAPTWMRRAGLEWAFRVAREPRRLALRYARDGWAFPQVLFDEIRRGKDR